MTVLLGRVTLAALLLFSAVHGEARPKIGVALGGGGARGCAHVGVLRVLEEMRIPIDYIAGTSMGAVVGGLYASGMSVDEIERALTTIDWRDALSDRTRYKDLAFRRKEDEIRYLTAFDAGLKRGRIVLPSGLRSGQKLRFILQSYLIPVAAIHDFSKLPVPFRAVAADIETGDAVVLDHGDLAEAIRASMSIPGVFSPMEIDGKLLVDGGVAANVPVDVVRAMGADVVIAVDVGSPLLKREQLGSLLSITGQVLTILTRKNVQDQVTRADLVLVPPVAGFATMGFESAMKIATVGAEYTRQQRDRLAHLAVAEETYAATIAARPQRDISNRPLDFLGIEGSRRVDNRIIRQHVATRPGKVLDGERLRRDVTKLYGLDDFQQVTFSIRDEAGQHGLILNLKDKPWGPTYARFGINLSDDLEGDSSYNFVFSLTRTRINALGAEWRNDFHIGRGLGIQSEFYQPLDFRGRFFVAPSFHSIKTNFSFFENGRRTAIFDIDQQGVGLDLGMQFEDWGALRAGVYRNRVRAGVDAGQIDLPHGPLDLGGFGSSLAIVRTDSPVIPREGGVVAVRYINSQSSLGGEDTYSKLEGETFFAVSRGNQTFIAGGSGGSNLGTTIPAYDEFRLGGLFNLAGFTEGQIHGQRFAALFAGTYRRIRTLPSDIGTGVYAGVMAEAGNAWSGEERVSSSDIHKSLTLICGAETIIGPVFLGYARADTGDNQFYITIGKTF